MADSAPQQPGATAPAQVLSIEKLYVKDASLEVPNAPGIFLENLEPKFDVQLGSQTQPVADGLYESTLTVTVTAKAGDKTVFLCEVAQAAIFQIRGFAGDELQAILGIGCPTTVFPYAREAVASLINRAGFPPINLAPVSFEALYMQQLQQQQAQSHSNGAAAAPQIVIAK